jgi:HlyD family secretion protein/adhesin transport system membrane fusion protein
MLHDRHLAARSEPGADDATALYVAAPAAMEESSPPALARLTILFTGLAVLGFLIWAALTPVKEITAARGAILPEGFVQAAQHLEGGRVESIAVAEGDAVRAGQTLLTLDGAALRAERAEYLARGAALAFAIERLESFAKGEEARFPELGPGFAALAETERSMLDAQIAGRRARMDAASADLAQRREALRGAEAALTASKVERALVARMVERREPLLAQGLVRLTEMEATQRDAIRLDREIAAAESEIVSLGLAVSQAEANLGEIAAELRSAALKESAAAQVERASVTAALLRLDARIDRLALRAPVGGIVQRIAPKAPGAVLQPGDPAVEIVPDDDRIYAEVRVPPEEVGHIKPGLRAMVKVSTYDYVRFGGVRGEVERVSPTTELSETGEAAFRVRIRLLEDHVGPAEAGMPVSPGMEVVADIATGEKSVLRYLAKPIRAAFDRALTER